MPVSPTGLRVQIHLNLGHPELAETVVRVQSRSGAWVGVAYATEVVLSDVHPVVHAPSQQKIAEGSGKKTPHAFLEGTLVHFEGRLRDKAPPKLLQQARGHLKACSDFNALRDQAQRTDVRVNYNPRFATCFYQDQPTKTQIADRVVGCAHVVALGWRFWAIDPKLAPLTASDRCAPDAVVRASVFERRALAQGRATTEKLLNAAPSAPRAQML